MTYNVSSLFTFSTGSYDSGSLLPGSEMTLEEALLKDYDEESLEELKRLCDSISFLTPKSYERRYNKANFSKGFSIDEDKIDTIRNLLKDVNLKLNTDIVLEERRTDITDVLYELNYDFTLNIDGVKYNFCEYIGEEVYKHIYAFRVLSPDQFVISTVLIQLYKKMLNIPPVRLHHRLNNLKDILK